MQRGKVVIISGPSGVGKNTVLEMLIRQIPNAVKINTATTRVPRPGETEGKDHYFISKEQFQSQIKDGSILEHNAYNNNYYGTLQQPLLDAIHSGKIGVMEIDVNGGNAIKKIMPEVITVFITAESMSIIENRLRSRGTDSEKNIQTRLGIARKEIKVGTNQYDYVVINPEGHPEKAVLEIEKILSL